MTRTTFRAFTMVFVLCMVFTAAGAGTALAANTKVSSTSSSSTSVSTTITSTQVGGLMTKITKAIASGQQAQSGQLTQSATCGFGASSKVFLNWGDSADYALAPQGDMSTTSAWALSNTTVVADHDSYTPSTNSLRIAGNGQATSPAMCVNLTTPTIRFFVKTTAPTAAYLKVSVLYEDLKGNVKSLDLAKISGSSTWQPSASIAIVVNANAALSASGWTAVAFVFKPEGTSASQSWSIDNLYVDPYRKV